MPRNSDKLMRTPRCERAAFTLLEVVFALALSLLLMAALLSAVDLYRQVATTGREEVARAELARAILRQIECDIRACRFSRPSDSAAMSSALDSSDESSEEESTEVAAVTAEDAATAYTGRNIGVMGDATMLLVHMSRAPRPIDAFRQTDGILVGATTSDLRSVAYFLATPGGEGLSGAAAGVLANSGLVANSNGSFGLARLAGDPLSLEALDAASNVETLVAGTQLLATEVDRLAFRYFDGTTWYNSWDSVQQERLPVAVEVTLGIAVTGDGGSEVHRIVVPVAAAEPVETSDDYYSSF